MVTITAIYLFLGYLIYMNTEKKLSKAEKIMMVIYGTSMRTSMLTMAIVATLEVCMLIYTVVNPSLFGQYITKYRLFYIALLSMALIFTGLSIYAKKDLRKRFKIFDVANPIWVLFFFAWSLGITISDAVKFRTIDPTVFMTFSLVVPLSFYLSAPVYILIVLIADGIMLYYTAIISISIGPMINLFIFFIFQLVLGVSFMILKKKLAERIVEEEENADIDVMTGLSNRRVYEEEIQKIKEEGVMPEDLTYVTIDLNGLKTVNDTYGHVAGDKLIIGAAKCIEQCFGGKGKIFRIGGDEFVILTNAEHAEADQKILDLKKAMDKWTEENDLILTTASGFACHKDFPDLDIVGLAKEADKKMYESKADYYKLTGNDRRKYYC